MKISNRFNSISALRLGSYAVLGSLLVPLAGCGSPAQPPTSQSPMAQAPAMRPSGGLTTTNKVVLLAGAAAMYYYYQKSKKANAAKYQGQQIKYYLSKNGGIYYREPGNPKNVIWVKPPQASFSVPTAEAQRYSQVQGYNNQPSGNGLDYYFKGPGGAAGPGA